MCLEWGLDGGLEDAPEEVLEVVLYSLLYSMEWIRGEVEQGEKPSSMFTTLPRLASQLGEEKRTSHGVMVFHSSTKKTYILSD